MIKVLDPGFYTTVQDRGRLGVQEYGVPLSGVMDAGSATKANLILNNQQDAALLEMTFTGATLLFATHTNICICGADISPMLHDRPINMNTAIPIHAGSILSFGKLHSGYRAYLAVSGGICTPEVLGSRSMYTGITDTVKLAVNDTFAIKQNVAPVRLNASLGTKKYRPSTTTLGVFPGPEYHLLTEAQKRELCSKPFTVSSASNRMAYQFTTRMDNTLCPIISSLVLPGTVQLTPSGRLIILMRDCQTTGGYPRILQLSQAAIDNLSQQAPHAVLYFQLIQ